MSGFVHEEDLGEFDFDVGAVQQSLALAEAVILQALQPGDAARPAHRVDSVPSVDQLATAVSLDPILRADLLSMIAELARPNVSLLETEAVRARVRRIIVANDRSALHLQLRAEELLSAAALYESVVATQSAADTSVCAALAATRPLLYPGEEVDAPALRLAADAIAAISDQTLQRLANLLVPVTYPSSQGVSLVQHAQQAKCWAREAADDFVLLRIPISAALRLDHTVAAVSKADESDLASSSPGGEEAAFGLLIQPASVPCVAASLARPFESPRSLSSATPSPSSAESLIAVFRDIESGTTKPASFTADGAPSPQREVATFALTHGIGYVHTHRRPGEVVPAVPAGADSAPPSFSINTDVNWSWRWPDACNRRAGSDLPLPSAMSTQVGRDAPASTNRRGFEAIGRLPGVRISGITAGSHAALEGLLRCHDVIIGIGAAGDNASQAWGIDPFYDGSMSVQQIQGHAVCSGARIPLLDRACTTDTDGAAVLHPWARQSWQRAVRSAFASGTASYFLVARPRLLVAVESSLRGLSFYQTLYTPWPMLAQQARTSKAAESVEHAESDTSNSDSRLSTSDPAVSKLQDKVAQALEVDNAQALGLPVVPGSAYGMGCEQGSFRDSVDSAGVACGYVPGGSLIADPSIADMLQHYPSPAQQAAAAAAVRAAEASSTSIGYLVDDHAKKDAKIVHRGSLAHVDVSARGAVAGIHDVGGISDSGAGNDGWSIRVDTRKIEPSSGAPRVKKQRLFAASSTFKAAATNALVPKALSSSRMLAADNVPTTDRLQFSQKTLAASSASPTMVEVTREDILIAVLRVETRYQRVLQRSTPPPAVTQTRPPTIPSCSPASDSIDATSLAPTALDSHALHNIDVPGEAKQNQLQTQVDTLEDDGRNTSTRPAPVIALPRAAQQSEEPNTERQQSHAVDDFHGHNVASQVLPTQLDHAVTASTVSQAPQSSVSERVEEPTQATSLKNGLRVSLRMLTAAALRRVCSAVGMCALGDKFALATRLRQLIRGSGGLFRNRAAEISLAGFDHAAGNTPTSVVPFVPNDELIAQGPPLPPLTSAQSSSSIIIATIPDERPELEAAILAAFYPHPEVTAVMKKTTAVAVIPTAADTASASSEVPPNLSGSDAANNALSVPAPADTAPTLSVQGPESTSRIVRQRKPSARLVSAVGDATINSDEISSAVAGIKRLSSGSGPTQRKEGGTKKARQQLAAVTAGHATTETDAGPLLQQQPSLIDVTSTSSVCISNISAVEVNAALPDAILSDIPSQSIEFAPVAALSIEQPSLPDTILLSNQAVRDHRTADDGTQTRVAACDSVACSIDDVEAAGPAVGVQRIAPNDRPAPAVANSAVAGSSPAPTVAISAVAGSSPAPAVAISAVAGSSTATSATGTVLGQRKPLGRPKHPAKSHSGLSGTGAPGPVDLYPLTGGAVVLRAIAKSVSFTANEEYGVPSYTRSFRDSPRDAPAEVGRDSSRPCSWRYAAYHPQSALRLRVARPSPASAPTVVVATETQSTVVAADASPIASPAQAVSTLKRQRTSIRPAHLASGGCAADFAELSPSLPPVYAPSLACELLARIHACTFIVHAPSSDAAQRWLVSARAPDAPPVVARALADIACSHGGGGDTLAINLLHREAMLPPVAGALSFGAAVAPATSAGGAQMRTSALDSVLTATRLALATVGNDLGCFPLQSEAHAQRRVRAARSLRAVLCTALRNACAGRSASSDLLVGPPLVHQIVSTVTAAGVCRISAGAPIGLDAPGAIGSAVAPGSGAVAEFVAGAATAEPLTADVDPVLSHSLQSDGWIQSVLLRDSRLLVQRVTPRDLGRAAAASEPIARFLASTKPFFVRFHEAAEGASRSPVRGECVGAIAALVLGVHDALGPTASSADEPRTPVIPVAVATSLSLARLRAFAQVVSAALPVPLLRCRAPLVLDAHDEPWPVPTLVRTSASHSSSFAASEAARRRLDAVVVELTDRGFHLLAAIVSSWVPPEGLPAFDEPCEPTAGSSEDRAVRPAPLESNGALPLASLGGPPSWLPPPPCSAAVSGAGVPGTPELYGPDAAGLVLAPLWEYVARGLLRTRLGQRLVHPAAVVQYVAAAAAALVGAGSTRAAVAAAPAPSVSSLRQWMPSWVAGGGGVQPQGSPTLKGGPEGVRPGAREQQQQAYRPSSSAAAVQVAGPDAAAGTVVASASPQAAVTGITVGC